MKTINRWFVISVILLALAIIITAKIKSKLRLPVSIRPEAETDFNYVSDNVLQSAPPPIESTDNDRELARFRYKIGTEGALAKLTVKVVDSIGRQVSGATVSINFIFFNNNGPENIVTGLTDNNGLFTAVKKTTWQSRIWVEKEGYYTSSADYLWNKNVTFNTVKNDRWQPWNPTIEVVLKEKRKPAELIRVGETKIILPKDEPVGYDCFEKDLVEPYGRGKVADFFIQYTIVSEDWRNFDRKVILSFPEGGGIIRMKVDRTSNLPYVYEAPINGYLSEFVLNYGRTTEKIITDTELKSDEYLLLRTRVKTDNLTMKETANYVLFNKFVVCENFIKGESYMSLEYSFNPLTGDRNLEMEERFR